jgi:proteasome lid subunit RPN8/RPN11
MLRLNDVSLETLFRHGEDEYPQECCGLLFSDGTVRRARNIQGELHDSDPAVYPRDATRGYTFSLEDLLILEGSFSTDRPAVAIYHSHPDVGAYFSDEDRDKALFSGVPIYPVSYVVVDVRSGRAIGASQFSFIEGAYRCVGEYCRNSPGDVEERGPTDIGQSAIPASGG